MEKKKITLGSVLVNLDAIITCVTLTLCTIVVNCILNRNIRYNNLRRHLITSDLLAIVPVIDRIQSQTARLHRGICNSLFLQKSQNRIQIRLILRLARFSHRSGLRTFLPSSTSAARFGTAISPLKISDTAQTASIRLTQPRKTETR